MVSQGHLLERFSSFRQHIQHRLGHWLNLQFIQIHHTYTNSLVVSYMLSGGGEGMGREPLPEKAPTWKFSVTTKNWLPSDFTTSPVNTNTDPPLIDSIYEAVSLDNIREGGGGKSNEKRLYVSK